MYIASIVAENAPTFRSWLFMNKEMILRIEAPEEFKREMRKELLEAKLLFT